MPTPEVFADFSYIATLLPTLLGRRIGTRVAHGDDNDINDGGWDEVEKELV